MQAFFFVFFFNALQSSHTLEFAHFEPILTRLVESRGQGTPIPSIITSKIASLGNKAFSLPEKNV